MKWTKIDVSNVNRSAVKWKVIVCNIIIMALCVASMLTMALGKFWVVDANLTINKAMADKLFGANASVDTSSFETNPVELQLKFGITSKMVLLGVVQDNEKIANSLIDEQVNSLMTQFRPMLGNVARMVVQAVKPQIESALSDVLKELLPEQLGEGSDFTEMKNKLSDAYGVDAQKIEDAVFDIMLNNIIIGCLVDENPNAVQLKTDFNANIDKIVAQLNGSTDADIVTTLNLTDEKVAMMKQSGATIIDDFTQSDKLGQLGGTIINAMRTGGDMMTALKETGIIDSFTIIFDDMKNPTPAMGAKLSPMEETTPPATETGTMEDELRALLHDNIPKDTISTIALSLRIVGILYAISILAFGILLLMTLIRTLFAKNKGVKMGVAIWLGGYWGILLVIIPLIAFLVLQAVGAFGGALAMMKFSFMSSSIVATACTFTMFVLWFLYGRQRKRMKAIAMADKYGYETSYEDAKQNGHV